MKFRFVDRQELERLWSDAAFDAGFAPGIVKAYRRRMQLIEAAADQRDFYALKGAHFEKLKGDRQHQCSMRLTDQWRLILEFEEEEKSTTVVIRGIEDYH